MVRGVFPVTDKVPQPPLVRYIDLSLYMQLAKQSPPYKFHTVEWLVIFLLSSFNEGNIIVLTIVGREYLGFDACRPITMDA